MRVDFYQLSARPVEAVLPRIAERLLAGGERLLIVAEDAALLARLDAVLWSDPPESFLPHAVAGTDDDTAQPILLSATPTATNAARNIALADGKWRAEALTFDRAFHLFDANTLAAARTAWRDLKDVERHFWKQDDQGRWTEAAT